jgi:hypothetical protein
VKDVREGSGAIIWLNLNVSKGTWGLNRMSCRTQMLLPGYLRGAKMFAQPASAARGKTEITWKEADHHGSHSVYVLFIQVISM